MTVAEALAGSGLPTADAEILLSRALTRDRTWLLAHPQEVLPDAAWTVFMQWVDRRRKHEPIAYIVGEQEFFGRPFTVDRRVLIPRPATEGVVRRALQFLNDGQDAVDDVDEGIAVMARKLRIENGEWRIHTMIDIGTGSGCIAITLGLERPDLNIIATDISADALDVARINAERHGVLSRIEFRKGRGLEPVMDLEEPFLLVSNPPYIPSGNDLMPDVKDYEPHVALFGGQQGNEIARQLRNDAEQHPFCVGCVMEGHKE